MAPSRADNENIIDLTDSPPPTASDPRKAQWPPPVASMDGADEADEDLKLAIALSLQQHEEDQAQAKPRSGVTIPVTEPSQGPPTSSGLLALDRKAMEAERLARLKRKRDTSEDSTAPAPAHGPVSGVMRGARISPPPLRRAPAPIVTTDISVHVAKTASPSINAQAPANPAQSAPASKFNAQTSSTIPSNSSSSASVRTYPNGAILKTYAPGYPTDRTISFTDLIAPAPSLTSCLLSSFIWDFDWLFLHFSTKATNFLLVMHAKYPSQRAQIESDFAGIPNVKTCFPPMEGNVNCMHSKLMLLFYPERCRVVVPTANLMGFDWGVGSVMENMVWLIDLPLLDDGVKGGGSETEFKKSLLSFLHAQTVPDSVLSKLDGYDFKDTQDIRFVHTVGGIHGSDEWRDTGHCGLGKAVTSLGLATTEPVDVDFVTSSVGSLNEEFMRSVYLACQGDDGLTEYTLRNAKSFPAKRFAGTGKELVQKGAGRDWRTRFRFYFPSHDTVDSSNGGPGSAGTICFSQKWWEGPKFPQENMRDCVSARGGLLMHNKVSLVGGGVPPNALCNDPALTPGLDYRRQTSDGAVLLDIHWQCQPV